QCSSLSAVEDCTSPGKWNDGRKRDRLHAGQPFESFLRSGSFNLSITFESDAKCQQIRGLEAGIYAQQLPETFDQETGREQQDETQPDLSENKSAAKTIRRACARRSRRIAD